MLDINPNLHYSFGQGSPPYLMPRKCTVCAHTKLTEINKQISAGRPYRAIALNYKLGVQSMYRHVENCLGLSFAAVIEKKKEDAAIDVYKEFEEQLAFAKQLREAAREYLSDPIDPLRINIIPFSHEISISYFDHTDLTDGDFPKPKKKTAMLSNLLMAVESIGELIKESGGTVDDERYHKILGSIIEIDRISIKHVDLRSFATDCIRTTDQCIDRFARLGGLYQKEAENKKDFENALSAVKDFITKHPDADKDKVVTTFASGRGIPAERIRQELGMIG